MNARTRLRLAALAAILIGSIIAACGGDDDAGDTGADELTVVATTTQIQALTTEVGGDHIALVGLIPPGADAHDFEPTASDLVAIEEASVILRHGIGLDDWLDDTLDAAENATVVVVTDGIELEEPALEHADENEEEGEHADEEDAEGSDEEDDHADEGGLDPHVWLDPDRAKQMVDNIALALSAADSENAGAYEENATRYKQTLDETKAEVQTIIDEIPEANRKLVTNHDAFGYFAAAFGLEIVGAVIPSTTTQSEPSAGETAELLELIEDEGVRAIFAESSVNADLARTLADDAGVTIVDDLYGDSLGEPGSGAETVHGMLLANARKIADALK